MKLNSFSKLATSAILAATITGCASGLSSMQQREYAEFEKHNVLVEEKNPVNGLALGLLPGGGSFYAREPVLGVANLILWPLSVLWDPISGYQGAKAINYDATRYHLSQQKKKALAELNDQLAMKIIDQTYYIIERRKIEDAYSYAP